MRNQPPTLYIHLPNYRFHDAPLNANVDEHLDAKHLEREAIEQQLRAHLLSDSNGKSGAILLTGFRGVGKTSLVHKVLREIHKQQDAEGKTILHAEINLAQDDIDSEAIFKLLAIELHRLIQRIPLRFDRRFYFARTFQLLKVLIFCLVATCMWWLITSDPWKELWSTLNPDWTAIDPVPWPAKVILLLGLPVATVMVFDRQLRKFDFVRRYMGRTRSALASRIEKIITRLNGQLTTEQSGGIGGSSFLNPVNWIFKRQLVQGRVQPKEIELELTRVLDDLAAVRKDVQIVFVVDELDKLIPLGPLGNETGRSADGLPIAVNRQGMRGYENELVRKRQEAIGSLFANMKHFLNVAQAKFIFLGGRELYDATLADMSNRDAFFGSVFSQVVHVPSFLKSRYNDADGMQLVGLASSTERFLRRALTTSGGPEHGSFAAISAEYAKVPIRTHPAESRRPGNGKDPYPIAAPAARGANGDTTKTERISPSEQHFLTAALHNYATYLTFRSNGIPKRMIQLFERRIVRLETPHFDLLTKEGNSRILSRSSEPPTGLYLRLDPEQLYAHSVLSQIYRPFLTLYSRHYRSLSDKNLVALTYIIDHILKFHPTSFNFSGLEMAPEVIAVNKVPGLRKFMTDVLDKLTVQHIRVVNNGMFNYQFFSKTANELVYLSKVSELDEAALNFTLDESLPVKEHFRKRLADLVRTRSAGNSDTTGAVADALPSLHERLGDLHFMDTEYEEALAEFRAATLFFSDRLKAQPEDAGMASASTLVEIHDYVKLILKQIHCLAKLKARDDAMVLSSTLSREIIAYLRHSTSRPGTQADANWRLLLLGVIVRVALVEKVEAKGLVRADIGDLAEFMKVLSAGGNSKNKLDGGGLKAHACMDLGMILHYGNTRLKLPEATVQTHKVDVENWLNRETSQEFYALAFWEIYNTDITKIQWSSIDAFCRTNRPNAIQTANVVSKYFDARVASLPVTPVKHDGVKDEPDERWAADWSLDIRLLAPIDLLDKQVWADMTNARWDAPYKDFIKLAVWSAQAYLLGGQPFSAVFQLKKLFYFIRECPLSRPHRNGPLMRSMRAMYGLSVRLVHEYNQFGGVQQERKSRSDDGALASESELNGDVHVSYQSELIELDILWYDLLMRVGDPKKGRMVFNDPAVVSRLGVRVCSQYTRARLLMFCVRYNWNRMFDFVKPVLSGEGTELYPSDRILAYCKQQVKGWSLPTECDDLLYDSISSCFNLISITGLFGMNFMSNYTIVGSAHENLGVLCQLLDHVGTRRRSDIIERLQRALEKRISTRLDPVMHFSAAQHNYGLAESMHNRGYAYFRAIGDLHYVEDDYNDNLYHFSCAMERLRLNNPSFNKRRVYLRQQIALLTVMRSGVELIEEMRPTDLEAGSAQVEDDQHGLPGNSERESTPGDRWAGPEDDHIPEHAPGGG